MPVYRVEARDKPGSSAVRQANRPAHLDWAGGFADRIFVAGPLLGPDGESMVGSLFILEGDSIEAVEMLFASDPYNLAGLFETVRVESFRPLIGRWPSSA